jgi:aryl-alcohol dehydrogenase-like predicted oxidoreductase
MRFVNLGRTGTHVSRLCLGTMQFGWTADRAVTFEVLDAFREAGGNFLDTANIYSRWAPGNGGGVAERLVGEWMRERNCRSEMVVATKVRGRMWSGPNGEGLSRRHIVRAVEGSLERLGTDTIDLYQSHWVDVSTPIEETMAAFDHLVGAGKVLYAGASNIPAWRLVRALWASDRHGLARYETLQPKYNLVHRTEYEAELEPLCAEQGLGVLPYSPLAAGFLTGKYSPDGPLPDSRRAEGVRERTMNEANFATLERLMLVAEGRGATAAQVALAWLLAKPTVTAPIIGANSVAQLAELLGSVELDLTAEESSLLEAGARAAG